MACRSFILVLSMSKVFLCFTISLRSWRRGVSGWEGVSEWEGAEKKGLRSIVVLIETLIARFILLS